MADKSKKPAIRFAGFTDAWEQRKLEEYLSVSSEKNADDAYDKTDVLSVSGDYGIVNQIEFQGRSFAGVSVSNYGVVRTGDVVYTKSPLNSNPYGIIKTNKGKTGIVSTLYAVYRPKENTYPDFVQTYFEQHARMNNYMHPLVNKGAKNDMKVSSENALKGYVIFPNYEEQKAISEYFAVIDDLITLHQRMCAFFGSTLQIRMDYPLAFAWEQRKLGECFDERQERSAEGELISVTINEGIKRFSDLGRHDNSSEDKSHYKKVGVGDIAYNSMRMWQGASGFSPYSGILSPAYTVVIPKADVDSLFFSYVFKKPQMIHTFQISSQGITSDTWNLKFPAFSEIETTLPKIEEQRKIAAYFKQLDTLITLHQRELKHTKNNQKL